MTTPADSRWLSALLAVLVLVPAVLAFAAGQVVAGVLCVGLIAAVALDIAWFRRRRSRL